MRTCDKNEIFENLTGKLEHIANMAKNRKLCLPENFDDEFILREVSDFLDCSEVQSIIFAVIFQLSFKNEDVVINAIAKYLKCSPMKILNHTGDINQLRQKRLIVSRTSRPHFTAFNYQEFYIPSRVSEAIGNMDNRMLQQNEKLKLLPLLDRIYESIHDRDNGNLTFDEMLSDVASLLEYNRELNFVRKLDSLDLTSDENILYLYTCREILNDGDSVDLQAACNTIWHDTTSRFEMKRDLIKGNSNLIKKDLVKLEDGFFKNLRDILLTDRSLELLLEQDADVIRLKEHKVLGLIKNREISKQNLFYNASEMVQLQELTDILQKKTFSRIQKRLSQKKMPTGIAILFHGTPGTGKTQSTYQIAAQTGRDIMMVDISDTKSMWFGESEKKIKAVFSDYKKLVKEDKPAPILVFNEADAVFSKRKDVDRSGVGQTENAIQNIILQEMEDFEGILIATTNLTFNFDKAFERRFLYKIEFHTSDVKARTLIWKDKIPDLTIEQAGILASKFEMSGGSIENVVRKMNMHFVLCGKKLEFNILEQYCKQESFSRTEEKKIGF